MTDRTSLYLAAETALTSAERAAFLRGFPHMEGASVADILGKMESNEHELGIVMPLAERYGAQVPEPELLTVAVRLGIRLHRSAILAQPWELTRALVERIRPLLGLTYDEFQSERAKRDKLELLAPLGFTDANDKDAPYNLYHPLIGHYDCREVDLSNVMQLAYSAGTA